MLPCANGGGSDPPPAVRDKSRLWPGFQRGRIAPIVEHFQATNLASLRRTQLEALLFKYDTGIFCSLDEQPPLDRMQIVAAV
jgi:hypothetical protein